MKSPSRSPAAAKGRGRVFDRHSGSGLRGLPKKNGAGGKTVWGAAMDQAPVTCLDKNDPNYDSENEEVMPPHLDLTAPDATPCATEASTIPHREGEAAAGGGAESPAASSGSVGSSPDATALPAPGTSL